MGVLSKEFPLAPTFPPAIQRISPMAAMLSQTTNTQEVVQISYRVTRVALALLLPLLCWTMHVRCRVTGGVASDECVGGAGGIISGSRTLRQYKYGNV